MDRIRRFFDLSTAQFRFLSLLCALTLLFGVYTLIRAYAQPVGETAAMPVFMGENPGEYTGVFVLDPNTAPVDSLELLPGVGRVLADRIVAYRHQHRFHSEIDITKVKGIGPKAYERLKPYLRIRQ